MPTKPSPRCSGRDEDENGAPQHYQIPAKPMMIPVEKGQPKQSEENTRSPRQDDDVTITEEGQEIMLIEDLQNRISSTAEGENNSKTTEHHKNGGKAKQMVRQVLLVPSNGDLILERYRQAAQRSNKARALLDQALDWEKTIHNRDQLAIDAFTEAGKARLLVELERTPELVAMLADAKLKGEEEVWRAADRKVSDLVPSIRLPADAAGHASASAVRDTFQHYPGLEHTATATATEMMSKDPALHCFQSMFNPHVTNMSGGYDDYEDGDDVDEHVYRAKQYLEFILPDLGEVRDDDSMAPKAGGVVISSKNLLQKQQLLLTQKYSTEETSKLGEISSLGFDESHSFDNISSQDTEDVFSMSSLNEIMDAPIDDFVPEKILNIPSMKRKRLTIRMSFGSKSFNQDDKMVAGLDKRDDENVPPSSQDELRSDVDVQGKPKAERKHLPLGFGKILSSVNDEKQSKGGLFWRFRTSKKKSDSEGNETGRASGIVGPVLSDLSDEHSESVAQSRVADEESQVSGAAKPENTHQASKERSSVTETSHGLSGGEALQTLKEGTSSQETSTKYQQSKTLSSEMNSQGESRSSGLMIETSLLSTTPASEDSDDDDRYTVGPMMDKISSEDNIIKPPVTFTPSSVASIMDMPSRYSPIQTKTDAADQTTLSVIVSPRAPSDEKVGKDDAKGDKKFADAILSVVRDGVANPADPSSADNNKASQSDTPPDEGNVNEAKSIAVKGEKKNKKKRRSLIGLFNRNEVSCSDEAESQVAGKKEESAVLKPKVTQATAEKKTSSSKKSSLQESLTVTAGSTPKASRKKKGSEQKPSTPGKQRGKVTRPSPRRATPDVEMKKKSKNQGEQKSKTNSASKPPIPAKFSASTGTVAQGESKKTTSAATNLSSLEKALTKGERKMQEKAHQSASKPAKSSSLKTALQLSQDTVEIMATGSIGAVQAPPRSQRKQTQNSSSRPESQPKAKSGATSTNPARKTRRFDKPQRKQKKTNPARKAGAKKESIEKTPATKGSHQTTRWVNNFGFAIKRKDQTSTSTSNAADTATPEESKLCQNTEDTATPEETKLRQIPVSSKPLHETNNKPSSLPLTDSRNLNCETAITAQTSCDKSSIISNPLLPFQLVKHLEEQCKLGIEDGLNAKEAAERSILQSHAARSLHRKTDTDVTHDLSTVISEKENQPASQTVTSVSETIQSKVRQQSPRFSGTPLSASKALRPDADGLNARTKDVREVLGLPSALEFGEERASSFFSRITQGTHRQDHALPDP